LLAVWAKKEYHYVEGLHHVLDLCEQRIASQPTVILGDFNSNTIWDNERRRKERGVSHTDLVNRLGDLGLVSAYHSHFVEKHGQERQFTFYFRKEEKRPFHIDYCFLPKAWKVTDVTLGSYTDWKAESDHTPLVVKVDDREIVSSSVAT
jgi:endonuclease/exonuclease/phosphatase family metal-dependent hydrolase